MASSAQLSAAATPGVASIRTPMRLAANARIRVMLLPVMNVQPVNYAPGIRQSAHYRLNKQIPQNKHHRQSNLSGQLDYPTS